MRILFFTRLALYAVLVAIPYFHPGVAVRYDSISRFGLMVLAPIMMGIAFFSIGSNNRVKWLLGAIIALAFSITFISGWNRDALLLLACAFFSYVWTRLVFARIGRFPFLASLEFFAFGYVYFKLLSFGRASADIAQDSAQITTILLALTIVAFVSHACVLYFAIFHQKFTNAKKIVIVLAAAAVVVLGLAIFIPPDFVAHNIVMNELQKEPPLNPTDLPPRDEKGEQGEPDRDTKNGLPLGDRDEKYPSELQNGREGSQGRPDQKDPKSGKDNKGERKPHNGNKDRSSSGNQSGNQSEGNQSKDQKNKGPKLEGVPSDQWNNAQTSGQGKGKQKAVMVIASPVQPVYAAEEYLAGFQPEKGFQAAPVDEALNALAHMRLMQTWKGPEEAEDAYRRPVEIFYLSTIEARVLAFRPFAIEPTIQDKKYKPFNLSYVGVSRINVTGPDEWLAAGNLSPGEREQNAYYLNVPNHPVIEKMRQYAKTITKDQKFQFQKVETILRSMKTQKYEMGFDEQMSLEKLDKFLFVDRKGDCTEFSQTVALLARLSGIPSRVVHGYLASRELQTPAHRGGVAHLRKQIPLLQKYKPQDLYLVTTSHHHAWVQFYMPQFGWIDFETTSFAIPPDPGKDPNQQDVLIPLVEEQPNTLEKKFQFPYRFVARVLLYIAGVLIAALYFYRSARMIYLSAMSRRATPKGFDSLFKLLIIHMAHEGYDIRPPFQTHAEYAKLYPALTGFADQFTSLRFREQFNQDEKTAGLKSLRTEYDRVRSEVKKTGPFALIRRIFSLKGIWI